MRLIDIDKVLSELCLSHKDIIYIDKNETAERIRKIPSIDIEPKRGEWKISNLPKGEMKYCSECGFGQYIKDERMYNFCPNCGAEMRERKESDR